MFVVGDGKGESVDSGFADAVAAFLLDQIALLTQAAEDVDKAAPTDAGEACME